MCIILNAVAERNLRRLFPHPGASSGKEKSTTRLVKNARPVLFCLLLVLSATSLPIPAKAQVKRYVCTPCSLPCDSKFFDKPGTCPDCGMALVTEAEAKALTAAADTNKKVAILIFNGVEIIDYTGPWEVFGAAGFDVFTVAESKDPVTTAMGMTVVPRYTFSDAPRPDILLVPGGGVRSPLQSPATLKWVSSVSTKVEQTMSVCNGAFILAKAGLLDGLTATTTHHLIDQLHANFPKVRVVYDQRYVDNGRIITTAGLTAGIDGAFHVVSKLLGKGEAQQTALGLEYSWEPDGKYARAALADCYLPEFKGFQAKMLSTEGDRTHWEIRALISSPASSADITKLTSDQLVSSTPHASSPVVFNQRGTHREADRSEFEWKFTDDQGRPWHGVGNVEPSQDEKGKFVATLKIAQGSR